MQGIGLDSDLQSRMSEATQPKSVGLPKLPPWDLTGTASQLYEQQEFTNVILGTYQTFLSDLIGEFNEKNTRKKAERVETAASEDCILPVHCHLLMLSLEDERYRTAQRGEGRHGIGCCGTLHLPEEGERGCEGDGGDGGPPCL